MSADAEESTMQMKTKMLEQTIFKIGTLLQRGFGELGASIISGSLTQTDYGMDLSLPGKKVEIVYSICRIRQYTDTTECLGDEIVVFVNKIVKIIHVCGQQWDGKPTKNYGERYMITWKLPSYEGAVDKGENSNMLLGDGNLGSQDPNLNGANNESGRLGSGDDDLFSKPQVNSGDQSLNMSSKIDERTSLLPDGTRADKGVKQVGDEAGGNAKVAPEENLGNGQTEELADQPMTRQQIHRLRAEVVDKALISAVKTLAVLCR